MDIKAVRGEPARTQERRGKRMSWAGEARTQCQMVEGGEKSQGVGEAVEYSVENTNGDFKKMQV